MGTLRTRSAADSHFDLSRIGGRLDEYAPGAILYMYLENFVTYDRCQVYPGPYMNMLMGPNGTGKSSIVAAMAIGLGFHPGVLGRSKDVTEFIKYGRDKAILETALRVETLPEPLATDAADMMEREGVLLLRRELGRSARGHQHSEWFINGRAVPARTVAATMLALNVQIDNLCQFLPQDKVSEFAKMTPAELLLATEGAAAEAGVAETHRQLIEAQGTDQSLAARQEELASRLSSLERQNESVAGILRRVKERQDILKIIRLCERKRPWLLYNSARDAYLAAKDARDAARQSLTEAEHQADPLRSQLCEAQKVLAQSEQQRAAKGKQADQSRQRLDSTMAQLAPLSARAEGLRGEVTQIRGQRTLRAAKIQELGRSIRQMEEEFRATPEPPPLENDGMRAELAQANRALGDLEGDMAEAEEQIRRISREGDRLERDMQTCSAELRQLDDVRVQRLETVGRFSPDCMRAHEWIKANAQLFREPVYGPICLDVDVKEQGLARQVESVISKSNLLNFVVTNFDDYEVFMGRICEEHRLKVNVTVLEDLDISQARVALDRRMLKQMGFAGTVLDLIDAPAPVLAALCDTAKIHLIPIAKGVIEHGQVEAAGRAIQKYASLDGLYEIRRSNYSDDVAVRCTPLKNAFFLGQSSSDERKAQLMRSIGERRTELARNQERMKRLLQDQESNRRRQTQLRDEIRAVNDRRVEMANALAAWRKKRDTLEIKRSNLSKLQNLDREDEDAREEDRLREELRRNFAEYATLSVQAAEQLSRYQQVVMAMGSGHLTIAQTEGEVARLLEELRRQEGQHEHLRRALEQAETALTESKRRAKELLEAASREELDEASKEAFADLPETLDELDRMLAVERAKAEMTEDGSSLGKGTIRQYEERQAQIASIRHDLDQLQRQQQQLHGQMAELHQRWVPAVEAMVSLINERFSDFFAIMRCAGQVRLGIPPLGPHDYRNYCLEILVKFRDNEALQVLSAQRQSGGEKSVATILYLLALQELAKSPFRVVDEINQGMDANNERQVHALIVDTATRAARSQYGVARAVHRLLISPDPRYFLITPKLLTGLAYHERMHVLCVFNGEGVPASLPS